MSTPIPPPLRAAAGLAALAIDSARKVPQQLVGLPVLAVSTALQASLKAQQAYAGLVARGDEVLGQLRGQQQDAPWARFDDEPAGARPPSAFDAAPEPADGPAGEAGDGAATDSAAADRDAGDRDADGPAGEAGDGAAADGAAADREAADQDAGGGAGDREAGDGVADALAAEDLTEALTAEAAEEAALVEEAERRLDPDLDTDVITLAEAQAEADEEAVLGEADEDEQAAADAALAEAGLTVVDLELDPAALDRPNGRDPLTEPGADLPADGMALAADAAAADATLAADGPLDGYLAVDPPVAGYDELSIPQLRGRLRALTLEQIEALVAYERANQARPPYLTMLENRLTTLRSR